MITNNFARRHNGPKPEEVREMLKAIGTESLDSLVNETIPAGIRLKKDLDLPKGISEYEFTQNITELARKNKVYKSFI
jgi:glycine dehydrogenase